MQWTDAKAADPLEVRARNVYKTMLFTRGKTTTGLLKSLYSNNSLAQIRVYPGADASFLLYEDGGVDKSYLDGAYSTVLLSWRENERTFTASAMGGAGYPEMPASRTFRVVVRGHPV